MDQTRLKYLVRDENNWKIDINGKKIKDAVIPAIKEKLMEGNNNNLGVNEICRNMKFLSDITEDKNQNKVLKDIGSEFLIKK